ncbi:MAG: GldG family protein [Clostridia bacterium]|nr:GldG family protein [Clostridia bacterium]
MGPDNSRRFKHGALAVVITVAVIAAVILINAAFSALAKAYLWYFDMTKEQVFTLSDATKEILSGVDSEVNIYFTQEEDAVMSGDGTNEYMKYIYKTAKELEKEFSNIHVKCVDIIVNPGFYDYYYNTSASKIYTTSVIVDSGGEFRLLSSDAFFVWDENRTKIWGYNGEAKFAATILQVTYSDMPSVCFTTGHGEKSADESSAFRQLCENAGYEVRDIDLSTEDIDDDVRILVINDPIYDFAGVEGGEAGNEIDKINSFLDDFGSVMIFADSENSKNLTNLSELLIEWGVAFRPGVTVRDTSHSITVSGDAIVAKYETENTLGASLYNAISDLSSMPKTVMSNAMPLVKLYDTQSVMYGTLEASTVLYSHDSAEISENGETKDTDSLPLMTITRRERIRDNDYIYSYMTVCGAPSLVSDKYLNSNSYANSDIILNTVRLTGREKIVADIDLKILDNTELDITVSQANGWCAVLAVLIPLVIAAVGIAVYHRRRKK